MKWLSLDKSHSIEKAWSLALRLSELCVSIAPCLSVGANSRLRRGTISTLLCSSGPLQSPTWAVSPSTAPVECLNCQEPAGERRGEWRQPSYHLYRHQQDPSLGACLPSPVSRHLKNCISTMKNSSTELDGFKPTFPHPRQSHSLGIKGVIVCLTEPRPARHCDPVWSIIIAQQAQVTAALNRTREQLFHDFDR